MIWWQNVLWNIKRCWAPYWITHWPRADIMCGVFYHQINVIFLHQFSNSLTHKGVQNLNSTLLLTLRVIPDPTVSGFSPTRLFLLQIPTANGVLSLLVFLLSWLQIGQFPWALPPVQKFTGMTHRTQESALHSTVYHQVTAKCKTFTGQNMGCEQSSQVLQASHPPQAVFGHVHQYGSCPHFLVV